MLGFLHDHCPGRTKMRKSQARKAADEFAEKLYGHLRRGEQIGWGDMPRNDAPAVDITSRPQVIFRGERLVVPSGIAEHFDILDIKVGNRSQMIESTAVPAQAFTAQSGSPLRMDVASIAQDVTLVVANRTRKVRPFRAALFGTATQ